MVFKTKAVIKEREGNYITIKVLIQQEEIRFINIYAPCGGAQDI